MKKLLCKSCIHWNNKQAELDYSRFLGICTCPKWKFNTVSAADVMVLDRQNLHPTAHHRAHRFENRATVTPIPPTDRSRYCFVTEEEFGCIHHKLPENPTKP